VRYDGPDSVVLFVAGNRSEVLTEHPYIEYSAGKNIVYRGYLSLERLANLLPSSVMEMKHSMVFVDLGYTLSSDGHQPVINPLDKEFRILGQKEIWDAFDEKSGMFFAYSRLQLPGMIMKTQMDAQSFYAELTTFRDKILLANLLLALILIGLAVFYSRQITTPLHQLIKAVQNISQGDLNNRIELRSNDEIGILANEFELMRQRLQESYQDMENKIRKRTEELQGAQTQITHQEKMASLGLMAAGIAHEIGNPLTSISSMAQVIRRKTGDEKTIEYVNNILKNIDRISRIVRELVDFSKPSSQKAALSDINDLVNSAVGIVKYDRRSKNINYILNLGQQIPRTVVVADHLLQVFLNILINAVDASEGFGNDIEVSTSMTDGRIEVEIQDQGIGIPEDKLNTIFEPFYTTKEVGKGTGLGLTVSYGLVQKMNGEIQVESTLKKGSRFRVIIPIKEELDQEA
jgi:signal transduction histidine kinase